MKHLLSTLTLALYIAGCAGSGNTAGTDRHYSMDAGDENIRFIQEAVENYYTVINAGRRTNNSEQPPFMQQGEFLAAKVFEHGMTKYAVVQTTTSDVFTCDDCTEEEWHAQRDRLVTALKSISKHASQLRYSVDEEKRYVLQTMPGVLYGVLRDDGHWWVYGSVRQLGGDEVVIARMKQETKMIMGPEYIDGEDIRK